MKIFSRLIPILFLLSFSATARADHHLVFLHQLIKLSSAACAVELEIEANSQNGFESVDRIEVNSTKLAELGGAAATIDAGGHVNTGDVILFASNSFVTQTGVPADVVFADGQCSLFMANANFEFIIDDPTFGGPNKTIDELTTVANFGGNNNAMVKSSAGASPQFIDLTASTLDVFNNAGSKATVGTMTGGGGGGGGGSGGGCTLEEASSQPPSAYFLAMGLVLVVITLHRIRS